MGASFGDLVHEKTTGTGTGNLVVARVFGRQRFSEAFSTGDQGEANFYAFISHQDADEWEVCLAYLSDANTLVRSTLVASSNGGSRVNFTSGTKDVTNALPASFYGLPVLYDRALSITDAQKDQARENIEADYAVSGVFTVPDSSLQVDKNVYIHAYKNYGDATDSAGDRTYLAHYRANIPNTWSATREFRALSWDVTTNSDIGSGGSIYALKGRMAAESGDDNLRGVYSFVEATSGGSFTGHLTGFLSTIYENGNSVADSVGFRAHMSDGVTAAFQAAGSGVAGENGEMTFCFAMRAGTSQPAMPLTAGFQAHGGGVGNQFLGYESNSDLTVVFRVLGNSSGGAANSGAILTSKYLRVGSTSAPTNTTAGDLTAVRLNIGNVAQVQAATISGDGSLTGYLRVGSNTAPANTTAGDLTAVRLNLGTSKAISGAPTTTLAYLVSADGGDVHSTIDVYKNAVSVGGFTTYRAAQGTSAVPTALQTNNTIGGPTWRGYGATAFGGDVAGIVAIAAENWTDAAQGTQLDVQVTPVGSVTAATSMRFIAGGGVTMTQYLHVGSLTVPTNAGAGVITGTKLSLGNTALGTRIVRIQGDLTGASSSTGMEFSPTIRSDTTGAATFLASIATTEAASFTLAQLRHFSAVQSTIGAGSTVTQQWGFYADSSMTGATSNMGFYGAIAAAANRWNVYMAGTARNYMAGALSIGGTTDPGTGGLYVTGPSICQGATAIPAGGTAGSGYKFSSTANFGIFFGSGAPTLTAAKGSLYLRSDGSTTNDRLYVNTDDGTTWTALTTAA